MYKIKKKNVYNVYFLFYIYPLNLKKLKCFFSLCIILPKNKSTIKFINLKTKCQPKT